MISHGEVSTMNMLSLTHSVQNQVSHGFLWVAGVLIGTAFLWPLIFAAYLWAVYAGKL